MKNFIIATISKDIIEDIIEQNCNEGKDKEFHHAVLRKMDDECMEILAEHLAKDYFENYFQESFDYTFFDVLAEKFAQQFTREARKERKKNG